MSRKRLREAHSVDTEAIEIYEDLANEKEEIRLKAAQRLLLKNAIEQAPSSEQLEKVLRRLIRGLCSGRKAARLGFSVALTEFLNQHAGASGSLEAGLVVDRLEELTRVSAAVSGQEEREHHFGRLFAAGAVIKSSFVLERKADEEWARLLDLVFELCKRKPWLREECAWVLVGAMRHLRAMTAALDFTNVLLCKLNESGLSRTPEGVAIWITAQQLFPDVTVPEHVWEGGNPLHYSETRALANILTESTSKDERKQGINPANQKGAWSPNLHFAWSLVFNMTYEPAKKCVKFADLWTWAVDEGLFAADASDERKYWGFTLLQTQVKTVTEPFLPLLFGKNLVRCLINQLAAKERFLHKSATKALSAIHARVKKQPTTALVLVSGLTSSHKFANFDKQSKTKAIEKILILSDEFSFSSLVRFFCQILRNPRITDGKETALLRQGISDLLLAAVRSRVYPETSDPSLDWHRQCMRSILAVFVELGYFLESPPTDEDGEPGRPTPSNMERERFRSKTSSLLAFLIKRESDASIFPLEAVDKIHQLEKASQTGSGRLMPTLDEHQNEPARQAIRAGRKTIGKLARQRSRGGDDKLLCAFELLYTMTILEIYNGDSDAVTLIDELQACYAMLASEASQQTDRGAEILVEILLSLVSKKSSLFRWLAEDAFAVCTSIINSNALASMITVVQADESASGQNQIFSDDGATSESEASDTYADDSSVGQSERQTKNGKLSEDDEDDESSLSEASENATDEELERFDKELALALGTRRADHDLAIQENESSDEGMDDEQMEALDSHLETMFRERKKVTSKKQDRKNARETLIVFKCRVLDLLQIYIKQQHLNPLAIQLILPLLVTVRQSSSKQVSTKAAAVLREFGHLFKPKSKPAGDSAAAATLAQDVLARIHEEACLQSSKSHATACSQSSILVAKILVAHGGSVADVLAQYSATQLQVLTEQTAHVKAGFFADWANWCVSVRGTLRP